MTTEKQLGRTLVASAAASLTARLFCHPIDTLKARRMAGFGTSAWDVLVTTIQKDGFRGLYKGFGTVAIVGTPAGALYLTTYEVAAGDDPSALRSFAAGFFAEAVACILYVPVDVVKERAQVGAPSVWNEDLLQALYRGYGATLWSFGIYSGLYFVFYEIAKDRLRRQQQPTKEAMTFETALVASLGAGGLASFLTSPLDLAKLRLQVATSSSETASLGFFPLLWTVYRSAGISGLFRGAGARVAFFAPSTAIAMAAFESFKLRLSPFFAEESS